MAIADRRNAGQFSRPRRRFRVRRTAAAQAGPGQPRTAYPGQAYPGQPYPGPGQNPIRVPGSPTRVSRTLGNRSPASPLPDPIRGRPCLASIPGQTYPGQVSPSQPAPGQYGPSQPPERIRTGSGGPIPPGSDLPGQPAAGQYPGQPVPGQYPGQPVPGQYPGQPVPGQYPRGSEYPGQPAPGAYTRPVCCGPISGPGSSRAYTRPSDAGPVSRVSRIPASPIRAAVSRAGLSRAALPGSGVSRPAVSLRTRLSARPARWARCGFSCSSMQPAIRALATLALATRRPRDSRPPQTWTPATAPAMPHGGIPVDMGMGGQPAYTEGPGDSLMADIAAAPRPAVPGGRRKQSSTGGMLPLTPLCFALRPWCWQSHTK